LSGDRGFAKPVFRHVFVIELGLLVLETDFTALDKGMFDDAGADIEDVARADHDIGVLAGFKGAGAVVDAQDLRGVQGDRLKRLFFGQTICGGDTRVEHQVAVAGLFMLIVNAKQDAGFLEDGGGLIGLIDVIVLRGGEVVHLAEDDGNVVLFQQVRDEPAFATPDDRHVQTEFLCKVDGDEHLFDLVAVDEELLLFGEEAFDGFKFQVGLLVGGLFSVGFGFPEEGFDLFDLLEGFFGGRQNDRRRRRRNAAGG